MFFGQIAPDQVPAHAVDWSTYAWVAVVGSGIGWCIEFLRKKAEVDKFKREVTKLEAEVTKLKTEEIKLAGDVLKELQRARDSYADACVECTRCVQELIAHITASENAEVVPARNRFCQAVTRKAIHSLCALTEWNCLSRKPSPEHLLSYVQNDVTAELSKIAEWVSVINMPMFIEGYKAAPLVISREALRPLYDIMRFIPQEFEPAIKELLYASVQKLENA